jgi:predicted nucleic acid-binding protein
VIDAALLETAILDANAVIGLAKAGCLQLLPKLFDSAIVPDRVVQEVTDAISRRELQSALADWLPQATPTSASLANVPPLQREADHHVLALALEHPGGIIVTGDRRLANRAALLRIDTIDALRVIQLLKAASLIVAAKPYLDRMRGAGFGIPDDRYEAILRAVGE